MEAALARLAAPAVPKQADVSKPVRLPPPPPREEGLFSHSVLAALAPHSLHSALRPAYPDIVRSVLKSTLAKRYEALGMMRKKRFGLADLEHLIGTVNAERMGWDEVRRSGKLDAVEPLMVFIGRSLDAEVEVELVEKSKILKFVDVEKKRPGKVIVSLGPSPLLGISF